MKIVITNDDGSDVAMGSAPGITVDSDKAWAMIADSLEPFNLEQCDHCQDYFTDDKLESITFAMDEDDEVSDVVCAGCSARSEHASTCVCVACSREKGGGT